ncbi:MAG: glycogen/starch synthase, partial [Bacteroidales bacterium]|nr:glycogen/starch synthase [Bacteroidales bacterium]
MREIKYKADYVIETGWEICNKIGGIHTVMAGKATHMVKKFNDNYILIGPDVWKETHNNPEFIENKNIYKKWHEYADKKGIKFRIGNWNVPGNPIVILVDFSQYIINKDQILTEYWEDYKLDSISGEWDYIEPALFGYAAAKAIESFYEYHISAQDKIVAHFNEWSSGTGVLYLKKYLPQVATVFTAHGNVLAKELANDNKHIAFSKEVVNADMLSYHYNIRSKYSLERTAVRNVD